MAKSTIINSNILFLKEIARNTSSDLTKTMILLYYSITTVHFELTIES